MKGDSFTPLMARINLWIIRLQFSRGVDSIEIYMATDLITIDDVRLMVHEGLKGSPSPDYDISETTRIEDLGLTSLQVAEIIMRIEDELDIDLDSTLLAAVRTVGELLVAVDLSACHQEQRGIRI
ncbi:acyl carrier protein [Nocardia niigatensis]